MATEALLSFFSSLPTPLPKPPPAAVATSIPSIPSAEERLALCLLSLSSGGCYVKQPVPLYRCSVCGKSFSSHQALGGHKSSHRRADRPSVEARLVSQAASSCGSAHQCSLCLRRFPTGQALGGHKRLHYGESTVMAASSSLSTKVRGFDLNLPPPPFTAEEEGEGEEVQSPVPRKKMRISLLE